MTPKYVSFIGSARGEARGICRTVPMSGCMGRGAPKPIPREDVEKLPNPPNLGRHGERVAGTRYS